MQNFMLFPSPLLCLLAASGACIYSGIACQRSRPPWRCGPSGALIVLGVVGFLALGLGAALLVALSLAPHSC